MTAGVGKRLSKIEREEVLRRYRAGESSEALGEAFGVTGVAIRAQLRRAGIDRRDSSLCHRIYSVNEGAFDTLDSEVAYWLGMLITDGSVYSDGGTPRVELQLATVDEEHVEAFRDFLGSDAPVRRKFNKKTETWSSIYSVRSARLATALTSWGVTSRKTFTATAHKQLQDKRDFWRGVVDGDGNIKDEGNFPVLRVLGTKRICEQMKEFCSRLVKPERIHIAPISSVFYVEMGGNDALAVEKLLYSDCRYALQRKRVKALALVKRFANRVFRVLPPRRKKR